jgi:CxxC-x17-CxxC domain-containing protein
MIDGVASSPFSARTFLAEYPISGNLEKVIQVSRERYSRPRAEIEEKIMRWSGLSGGEEEPSAAESQVISPVRVAVPPAAAVAGPPPKARDSLKDESSKRYPAVCSRCGAKTDVPFPPDPSRPIYCVNCYKAINEERRKQPM